MKRYRGGFVFLAMVGLTVPGCTGGKLTREKALALLKEKTPDLQASMPETANLRTDIWIPDADIDGHQQQRLAIKNVYEALRHEGLLVGPTTRPLTLVYNSGTEFIYFPVAGPDIGPPQPNTLSVVVARGTFAEVTGLTGEGETCQAEVRVEVNPTETFKRVNKILAQQKASLADPFIRNGWLEFWPNEEALHSEHVAEINFRKYDDGWRIVGQPKEAASPIQNQSPVSTSQRPPMDTMAIAKLMARANPDVELVRTDTEAQTLTIRSKHSSEVITFSADDVIKGKIRFNIR